MSRPKAPRKRNRLRPKFDRCRSLYLDSLEQRQTPPRVTELARLAGCDVSVASRAVAWLEAVRAAGARDDAGERYADSYKDN